MTRRAALLMTAFGLVSVAGLAAQSRSDLAGTWVSPEEVSTMMASVVPAWESLTIDADGVTITRGTRPATTERYVTDGEARPVTRFARQARTCRAVWEQARLVIDCVLPDRGPGDRGTSIATREVRSVDRDGQLVVELTWRSGEQVRSDRRVFRRDVQP